jgi:translation initiation factor IF-2
VLREKEVEEKRKHDEEVLKQQQEVVKARAVIAGPVQVGKIDLNPKKAAAVNSTPKFRLSLPQSGSTESKNFDRKASCKRKGSGKVVADKKEVKAVIETKEPVKEPVKRKRSGSEEKSSKQRRPAEEAITTQYQKLSGTKLTGQTIDLSQFNKPKRKKKSLKLLLISLVRPVLQERLIRINAKELLLNRVPETSWSSWCT